ncbi:MAG: ATP synthase F1 subunit epsilon [Oscillospiraceae bacterium]|jgi:F-type H+-transporting ATPase subunit epsilon|nr:ATP synthase F1 subunit epsilon [Oscillospiraceae bacterium]
MPTFHLQIVTPDGGFYDGDAEKLIVRALGGDVCILPRHAPYVTALGAGEAMVVIDGQRRNAACAGGMLAVTQDDVRLVATTFEWAEDIDKDRAKRAKEEAERRIQSARDAHELEMAKAKLSRALARIKAAG